MRSSLVAGGCRPTGHCGLSRRTEHVVGKGADANSVHGSSNIKLNWYTFVVELIRTYVLSMYPFYTESGRLYCIEEDWVFQLNKRLKVKIRLDIKKSLFVITECGQKTIIRLRGHTDGFWAYLTIA